MSASESQSILGAALAAIQASVVSTDTTDVDAHDGTGAAALAAAEGAGFANVDAAATATAVPASTRRRNNIRSANAKGEAKAPASAPRKGRSTRATVDETKDSASESGDVAAPPQEEEGTAGDPETPDSPPKEPPQVEEPSPKPFSPPTKLGFSAFPASLHAFAVEGNKTVPACTIWDEGDVLFCAFSRLGCGFFEVESHTTAVLFRLLISRVGRRQGACPFTSTKAVPIRRGS
jgi:hypothetical protein